MVFARGGKIHVYTGNGKGKSTAAFGLALRMAGHGGKVLIVQFMKERLLSGEARAIQHFDSVTLKRYGLNFIGGKRATREQIAERVWQGLGYAKEQASAGDWDMVVLDEILVALSMELISRDDILEVLSSKDPRTEIVLTGRDAPQEVLDIADLVTEMREVKHPFRKGVRARKGIEY